jgi:glucose-6-phosphate isomerase
LKEDRAEYYWGVQGEGMLLLMNTQRELWAQRMFPGSLHYIGGGIAHRVANTSDVRLIFGASWPSDAGHNYEDISRHGFSARLMDVAGTPTLIPD